MKRVLSFLTASLVISLATSGFAQSTVSDVNSKITPLSVTSVSAQQLPKSVVVDRKQAERKAAFIERRSDRKAAKMERHQALKQRVIDRKKARKDVAADKRREAARDFATTFKAEHPKAAKAIVNHRDFLKREGIAPVQAMRNPQMLEDRMIARHSK